LPPFFCLFFGGAGAIADAKAPIGARCLLKSVNIVRLAFVQVLIVLYALKANQQKICTWGVKPNLTKTYAKVSFS
jgi:hypothetical protein